MSYTCWNCALEGDKAWSIDHQLETGHKAQKRPWRPEESLHCVVVGDRVRTLDGYVGTVDAIDDEGGGFWVVLDDPVGGENVVHVMFAVGLLD